MSKRDAGDAPGMVLHGVGAGEPTLVFLHGLGSDGEGSFKPQIERYSTSHRVLTVDLPGHGASPERPLVGGLRALGSSLARAVASQASGPTVLVGHSLGGILALAMASELPGVRAVALLDVPILMPPEVVAGMRSLRAALDGEHADAALEGFAAQSLLSPSSPSWLREEVTAGLRRTPRATVAALMEAMAELDAEPLLTALKVPGVFVHAGAPVDLGRLARLAPGLRVVSVPDCGHYVQRERPERVHAELDALLDSLS